MKGGKKEKRILYIVPDLGIGSGVTSAIMHHYDRLLEEGYRIDFCLTKETPSPCQDRVLGCGSRVFVMPEGENGYPDKKKTPPYLAKILKKGKYDIIHTHIIGRNAVYAGRMAKSCRVPHRIFHAHNPKDLHDVKSILRSAAFDTPCLWLYNAFMACSEEAGMSFFGKRPFFVLHNTIDTERFSFSEEAGTGIRKELGIPGGSFVVGTACRHVWQKNPFFLLDIFAEVKKKRPDAVLIWAGDGELEGPIREAISQKGLSDAVFLLGKRPDMAALYSAMDVFLLPSRFEGLGIVLIEAQASGLTVFASDRVPKETAATELLHRFPLSLPAGEWAEKILAAAGPGTGERGLFADRVAAAGFDSRDDRALADYYFRLMNR